MTARSPHEAASRGHALGAPVRPGLRRRNRPGGNGLHHAITAAHPLEGLIGYPMVFFAIWWAWMNFTWFASAYDCDDVPYRLAVFVQMAGALMIAAGIAAMFETRAPDLATIGGYVVMRLALVAQWLRAARFRCGAPKDGAPLCRRHYGSAAGVDRCAVRARDLDSGIPRVGGTRIGAAIMGGGRSADHMAPASHRGTIRSAHADRARRVDPGGDHRRPVGAVVW